jgi:hypothetical protein
MYWPVLVTGLALCLTLSVLFVLALRGDVSAAQIQFTMSLLLLCFALIPLTLVLLLVNVLFLFLAFGGGALPPQLRLGLRWLGGYAQKGRDGVKKWAEELKKPFIAIRTNLAFLRTFGTFLGSKPPKKDI